MSRLGDPARGVLLLRRAATASTMWAQTSDDPRQMRDGFLEATRAFLALGDLDQAKRSLDLAISIDIVLADEPLPLIGRIRLVRVCLTTEGTQRSPCGWASFVAVDEHDSVYGTARRFAFATSALFALVGLCSWLAMARQYNASAAWTARAQGGAA